MFDGVQRTSAIYEFEIDLRACRGLCLHGKKSLQDLRCFSAYSIAIKEVVSLPDELCCKHERFLDAPASEAARSNDIV